MIQNEIVAINSVGGVLCHHELMDCLYSELSILSRCIFMY